MTRFLDRLAARWLARPHVTYKQRVRAKAIDMARNAGRMDLVQRLEAIGG